MYIHLLISTAEQLVEGSPHLLDKPYLLKYMLSPRLEWNTSLCFSNNSHELGRQQPTLEGVKYIVCDLRLQNRRREGIKFKASCAKLISGCFNPPPHVLVEPKMQCLGMALNCLIFASMLTSLPWQDEGPGREMD